MYTPKHFEERDVTVLHALIRSHPLGTWVTQGREELVVNHIPFLVDSTRGEYGTLIGHVARANPIWKSFAKEMACVVIFQGPQTYITPSWYPTKHAHGKAVPTWNYAVVHAHGVPRNRPLPDKLGTIAGLYERGDASSMQMAELVQRHVTTKEG